MKKLKSKALQLWKDESGQGTAEYVLILVAVVGLAIVFRNKIKTMLGDKIGDLSGKVMSFSE
jgi:Flp pilus assembly pilin Flp